MVRERIRQGLDSIAREGEDPPARQRLVAAACSFQPTVLGTAVHLAGSCCTNPNKGNTGVKEEGWLSRRLYVKSLSTQKI